MHELAITRRMLDIALDEAERLAARRIKSIRLLAGEFSCLDPNALDFCFALVSRGTIAEGAILEIELVKATAICSRCETSWMPVDDSCLCPNCGNVTSDMFWGQELRLDSLEVE